MLREINAYPEGPVSIANMMTPMHAAAMNGDKLVMKTLIKDIERRKDEI